MQNRSGMSHSVAALIGLLVLVACFTHSRAQIQAPGVSFLPASSVLSLREPVVLQFELHNESDGPIRTDLGQNLKGTFALSVSDPDGTITSEVSLPPVTGLHRTGEITVMPGDTYRQELLLNEWVDFPVVGVYVVEIAMKNPIWTGNERILVESFRTQIDILPRNEARLRETCDRLAAEIENSNSVEIAVSAAEALASVRDSVALPYLKRALDSGKYVERQIIGGLERIGSRRADCTTGGSG